MNIILSSTIMRSEPNSIVPLETECLFGESIEILEEHLNWVYCKLITDNYRGWIKKKSLGTLRNITHRIINKRTFIYKEANAKSDTLIYLPMGSKISVEKIKSDWAETCFHFDNKIQVGYIPIQHIVVTENKVKDWVSTAQQLEDTPYKWGGRDTVGIDCSALLQLSYQTYGQNIPRNTSDQMKINKKIIDKIYDLKRGCVIFWQGHVGIMVDKLNCIHANAFHMKTITEPLIEINNRMGNELKIIKMMDLN